MQQALPVLSAQNVTLHIIRQQHDSRFHEKNIRTNFKATSFLYKPKGKKIHPHQSTTTEARKLALLRRGTRVGKNDAAAEKKEIQTRSGPHAGAETLKTRRDDP